MRFRQEELKKTKTKSEIQMQTYADTENTKKSTEVAEKVLIHYLKLKMN